MIDAHGAVAELRERARRHPPDRYPVQHATAQFHLGAALAQDGRLDEARAALEAAAALFEARLPVEHAKALNSLGAVERMAGRTRDAVAAFERASALFAATGNGLERGAALYNLGLAARELGDAERAVDAFREALELLDGGRVPAQAAAAARELGATLLLSGDLGGARPLLERAEELADAARDTAGMGAAANALGLVHLGEGRLDAATRAFRRSAAAHPRSVRPDGYALAKANLALAFERAGEVARARLSALQALASPELPQAVGDQASGVLDRLGRGPGEVLRVLDAEAPDAWPGVVREEVVRWISLPDDERHAETAAWIEGQLARDAVAVELAGAWLGALLEAPPDDMERLIRTALRALAEREPYQRERFRSRTEMAMARFHVPQMLRLRDTFERLGREPEAAW
ncbi:MAG TPA: tetratricopeptide repeat protein [Actinomycetota bacterium]|nr:tetratricopeptide repeat protein [Actinomycetota bacterium]